MVVVVQVGMLVGGVENEPDFGDEVLDLGEDFGGKNCCHGGGPFGGCEMVCRGGFYRELGIAEEASGRLEAVECVSGKEWFRGPVFGVVDIEGAGELGGCGGDAGPCIIQGMLRRRALGIQPAASAAWCMEMARSRAFSTRGWSSDL